MPSNKPPRWRAFHLPKAGNRPDEYEDAFAANAEARRFAIADGASESSFAGLWAKLLTEGFVRPAPKPDAGTHWIEPLQKHWANDVDGKPLPWYAEDKRGQGAFATFCGFSLRTGENGGEDEFRALAVGDCCLFQVRDDQFLCAFPVTHATDFGNRPELLNSRREPAAQLREHQKKGRGLWHKGDRFILSTDALAQWFLADLEAHHKPWRAIDRLLSSPSPDAAFAEWIAALRAASALRNDDVTLMAIDV
jgi:hypothetical protein